MTLTYTEHQPRNGYVATSTEGTSRTVLPCSFIPQKYPGTFRRSKTRRSSGTAVSRSSADPANTNRPNTSECFPLSAEHSCDFPVSARQDCVGFCGYSFPRNNVVLRPFSAPLKTFPLARPRRCPLTDASSTDRLSSQPEGNLSCGGNTGVLLKKQ